MTCPTCNGTGLVATTEDAPDGMQWTSLCAAGHMCPATGRCEPLVETGGHRQCVVCKVNVEPCCQGAGAD